MKEGGSENARKEEEIRRARMWEERERGRQDELRKAPIDAIRAGDCIRDVTARPIDLV